MYKKNCNHIYVKLCIIVQVQVYIYLCLFKILLFTERVISPHATHHGNLYLIIYPGLRN